MAFNSNPFAGRGAFTLDPELANAFKLEMGRYIKDLRESLGLTQQDLADATGLPSKAMISHIERGRNFVPPERYLMFAEALNVPAPVFMKEVLKFTNPWAYTLLFRNDPGTALRHLEELLPDRERTHEEV